ncbi:MAG: rod shape-determining protein MreC [Bacteroidia bacterium]|nr:rod shape-determining protein MreC [Bacteroidia bacterium]
MNDRKIGKKLIGAAIFILMEIAALGMLKNSGELQNIWLSKAAHGFSAKVWGQCENIRRYFLLGKENERLAEENYVLSEQLRIYKALQDSTTAKALSDGLNPSQDFTYIPASIMKISRNSQHNYFIINKGYEDGVTPQSGVITSRGIVGIIDAVERHYSYGLSFMNSGLSISARLGNEGAVGPLAWDGLSRNEAILKELPLQYKFERGDTVWTSGFSSLFPADIPLGVTGDSKVVNGAVNEINVTLFQDFSTLKFVTVVTNSGREEITYLENLEEDEPQEDGQ